MERAQGDKLDVMKFLVDHIAGWNWVDTEGKPLPLPQTEDDLNTLYDEEVTFLAVVARKAMTGRLELTKEAEKN